MASAEHLRLSEFIKSIHQKLRDDTKILGTEEAWQKHSKDENNLEKYASAMQNLASNHWEPNYKKGLKSVSRVEWIYQFSQIYFNGEEILKQRQRELEIGHKINLKVSNIWRENEEGKLHLLDVGSCYNPFKIYPCYNVVPVDIAPANSDVYKCDFLKLEVTSRAVPMDNVEICELQTESFDLVVFSLLLEYLPSPVQRHLCCQKAYNLLKVEGVLIIITPDSKHVGANAKIMKSWRFILAKLGFSRIKYEKLYYLHCMVFRKSLRKEIAQRWALLQDAKQFFDKIVIPQDFTIVCKAQDVTGKTDGCDVTLFEQLPFTLDD